MRPPENEAPPLLGSWPKLYALIVAYLVLVIVGLYFFAHAFRL